MVTRPANGGYVIDVQLMCADGAAASVVFPTDRYSVGQRIGGVTAQRVLADQSGFQDEVYMRSRFPLWQRYLVR
ncbi:hypothetical protein LRQ08_29765 (plasmid) [Rhodococcus qingshengii]|uniref:Uncharacterized protein n=1 Tax=Rhodococcus qingshengii TaxID=334542 RepID=A0AAW6LSZ9_RHOSG|nr:hypothetical protein [Rhodococcus qingshengii]MDE8649331.1 hypothetical protein [Rhodococcus qingshengii]UUE28646.1 hypothetical protein LRQ08_29765 [Rhodococcus qingshengii]